jgi:NAD(P)-dependent dehydrogenase (short-subunit alcohol dehydrogenase family)
MGRLTGKVLLVSGGGADGPPAANEKYPIGNGRATAIVAAREGAAVMVADRALEAAQITAEIIASEGGRAQAIAADVGDESACRAAVEATVSAFGGLQLLVNNVGIAFGGDLLDTATAEFDTTMTVNVRGHFLMMKYAVAAMAKAGGGAIVNVSSISGIRGGGVPYATSKAALLALSRTAALAHAGDGIRVNTVLPGFINSTIWRRLVPGDSDGARISQYIPLKRQGTCWEVANAIVFLLSDDASYITAAELLVDGGVCGRLETGG